MGNTRAAADITSGPADAVLILPDVPDPQPAAGEVLVSPAYSGVNPTDVRRRAGAPPGVSKRPYPMICRQSDGAGTTTAMSEGADRSGKGSGP